MRKDPKIEYSELCQRVEADDTFVEILIYRLVGDRRWQLEVVDEEDASTVWDKEFETAQDALEVALRAIEQEGIRTFLEERSATRH